jgi:6-phosphogluconate dehydrogenase
MQSEFAIIGLGKIGGALASQAVEKGYRVVGFARHGVPAELLSAGVIPARTFADLRQALSRPRIDLHLRHEAVDREVFLSH